MSKVTKRMPPVEPNESEDDYVGRFMADEAMVAEYPDEKQRAAVAHSSYKDGKKARGASLSDLVATLKSIESVELTEALVRERGLSVRFDDDGRPVVTKAGSIAVGEHKVGDLRALVEQRGFAWDDGVPDRVVPYWASDERVDGQGDIVRQSWDFKTFEKNPAMPLEHGWQGLPVGGHVDWQVVQRNDGGYDGPALRLLSLFAPESMNPHAGSVLRLVKAGFLRGGSVGFVSRMPWDVRDEKERKKLGLGRHGMVWSDNELLEFSPALMPANQGAMAILSRAKSRGGLMPADMLLVREACRQDARIRKVDPGAWVAADASWIDIARVLFPRHAWVKARDVDEPIVDLVGKDMHGHEAPAAGPDAVDDPMAKMTSRMDRMEAMMEEGFSGMSSMMGDVRDMLEEMRATTEGGPAPAPAKEEPRASKERSALREGIDGVLRKLDQADAARRS